MSQPDHEFLRESKAVLVASRNDQIKSVIRTLEKHEFDKSELLAWSERSIEFARLGVVTAAEAVGLTSFSFEAWSGIQGAGKGTNLKAIREAAIEFSRTNKAPLPPSLASLLKRYSGDMGEIITGTGGMFFRPEAESEYADLFLPIAKISKPYSEAGELVPDLFVSTMVSHMIRKRILEGNSGVHIDLYPRDRVQFGHTIELMDKLKENGVATSLTVVDLRLLPTEAIKLLAEHPSEYAAAALKIGDILTDFHSAKKVVTNVSQEEQFRSIDIFLLDQEKLYAKNSASWWLIQETQIAVKRARDRGRADDNDPLALIKRLASYYKQTMPGLIEVSGTKYVSADQKPSEVVKDLVISLLNVEDQNSPAVNEFIRIAQEKADAIVNR